MGTCVRSFFADLANAKQTHLDNIFAIQRGESDGEVSFRYINDGLDEPLEIRVLATGAFISCNSSVAFTLLTGA